MGQLQKRGLKSHDVAFSLVATEAPTEFSILWDRVYQDFAPGRSDIPTCRGSYAAVQKSVWSVLHLWGPDGWIRDRWLLSDGTAPPVHEVWLPACLS